MGQPGFLYNIREYSPSIIAYPPEGIVYADQIIRHDIYATPLPPIDADLILRIVPELKPITKINYDLNPPFATILSVNGDVIRDELMNLRVACLEKFHGKIYVGIQAGDPDDINKKK